MIVLSTLSHHHQPLSAAANVTIGQLENPSKWRICVHCYRSYEPNSTVKDVCEGMLPIVLGLAKPCFFQCFLWFFHSSFSFQLEDKTKWNINTQWKRMVEVASVDIVIIVRNDMDWSPIDFNLLTDTVALQPYRIAQSTNTYPIPPQKQHKSNAWRGTHCTHTHTHIGTHRQRIRIS